MRMEIVFVADMETCITTSTMLIKPMLQEDFLDLLKPRISVFLMNQGVIRQDRHVMIVMDLLLDKRTMRIVTVTVVCKRLEVDTA